MGIKEKASELFHDVERKYLAIVFFIAGLIIGSGLTSASL